jgi:thioredoxin reductase
MTNEKKLDAIIVGGSYSGLSAALSLGRASRQVLIIDSGKPCNIQTPYSHNFITQDGKTPEEISSLAKAQVEKYDTIRFYNGVATGGVKTKSGFEITTDSGDTFLSRKLLFATGIKDLFPDVEGYAECWGISILHCPYCHGYEVRNQRTGLLGNGDAGFEFTRMIAHWTKDLTLFTNGKSTLTPEQTTQLKKHHIQIIETEIERFDQTKGNVEQIVLKDGIRMPVRVLYAKPKFVQHCSLPENLGCELTEQGLIKTDPFQKTTVAGIFASGDNANFARAVSVAVSTGTIAGAMLNKEIIEEEF